MARLEGNSTIKIDEMIQKVDLKKFYGRNPTEAEKKRFSNAAIELINQRSLNGTDVDGKTFKQYTEEYARKKGVTVDSVDMFLNGDMLDAVRRNIAEEDDRQVAIEVDGSDEVERGFAHQTGDGNAKKRQWFGLTHDDAKGIALDVKKKSSTTLSALEREIEGLKIRKKQTESTRTNLSDLEKELAKLGIEQVF